MFLPRAKLSHVKLVRAASGCIGYGVDANIRVLYISVCEKLSLHEPSPLKFMLVAAAATTGVPHVSCHMRNSN